MDFTVDVGMFQNGAQNMYFRTVNDGSQDVTVLCNADGKAIHAPELGSYQNVLFTVADNGSKIDTITSDSSISREGVSNACGGDVNVTALDAGESVFLLVMGTHIQFCNADETTTTPTVTEWVDPYRAEAPFYTKEVEGNVRLLDKNGRVIVFNTGSNTLSLVQNSGVDYFVFSGQPLDAEKTTPLPYVNSANVYQVVNGTITQTAEQLCTTDPTPVPWNE